MDLTDSERVPTVSEFPTMAGAGSVCERPDIDITARRGIPFRDDLDDIGDRRGGLVDIQCLIDCFELSGSKFSTVAQRDRCRFEYLSLGSNLPKPNDAVSVMCSHDGGEIRFLAYRAAIRPSLSICTTPSSSNRLVRSSFSKCR